LINREKVDINTDDNEDDVAWCIAMVCLLRNYECYDLMPNCSKLVVVDTQLDVCLLILISFFPTKLYQLYAAKLAHNAN